MKKTIVILLVLTLGACTNPEYTIQLNDGQVITAQINNGAEITYHKGDTVVIKDVTNGKRPYIYGRYVGKIPKNFTIEFDSSLYYITHETGVIVKRN